MSAPRVGGGAGSALLITNLNTHYRDPLFRLLQERGWRLFFYSDGGERWAERPHPVQHLGARPVRGWWVGGTRIVPSLIPTVLRAKERVVVKCVNGRFALPVTYALARLRRKPFVIWTGVWREPETTSWRLGSRILHRIYRRADAVITYGPHVSAHLRSIGVTPARIHEALQSIDNERFDAVRIPRGSGPFRVITVGRLVPEKGLDSLVDALTALPEGVRPQVRLSILGDGPEHDALVEQIDRLQLGDLVHFEGRVPNDELPQHLRQADALVLPSRSTPTWTEPWGLVVNEAMAAGCPVIASDMVGAVAGGLLEDGVTGLTFAEGDAAGLARAIARLELDPSLGERLAHEARGRVADYTHDGMADAFDAAVAAALGSRRAH